MKNIYEKPELNILLLDNYDVVTLSETPSDPETGDEYW